MIIFLNILYIILLKNKSEIMLIKNFINNKFYT